MIRKCTDEDISDEELEKVINPFYDNYHEYIITYVMPEVIAFYFYQYNKKRKQGIRFLLNYYLLYLASSSLNISIVLAGFALPRVFFIT